jgi:RES domain-containing protein
VNPPRLTRLDQDDTHRMIPSKYSEGDASVLARIADDDEHLQQLFDLDHATNDRLLAENDRLPGVGVAELVFGVQHHRIINAAFTHAHPLGSRFNSPERGAWYAAFELATAQAEVIFHKTVALAEIDRFEDDVTYDDYLADFAETFHDIRGDPASAACLDPGSYEASQRLAQELLAAGSSGVIYPSVRRAGGTCLACFKPALVTNVRKAATYRLAWRGDPVPEVTEITP